MELTNEYEIHEDVLRKYRDAGNDISTALDIGCGKGLFSKAVKQVFPDCFIVGIDAVPAPLPLAREWCNRVVCAVLSHHPGIVDFHYGVVMSNGQSYYRENSEHPFVMVPTFATTLSQLMPDNTFDLVKLDTQGSERDIITGGSKIVSQARIVFIETAGDFALNDGAPTEESTLSLLRSMGFVNQQNYSHHHLDDRLVNRDWVCTKCHAKTASPYS